MTIHPATLYSTPTDVRCLACEQITKALAALTESQPLSDEAVHDARKRLKKVRAFLRLLRPAIGGNIFRRENRRMRDAARPLTDLRDAKILVDAFDDITERCGPELDKAALGDVRCFLVERQTAARRQVIDSNVLKRVAKVLTAARARMEGWRVRESGSSLLRRGLRRVYRKGRKARVLAFRELSVENLHEWRKQTKYLWHGLEVVAPLGPAALQDCTGQAHDLADLLGEDHDLAVLRQTLKDAVSAITGAAALAAFLAVIDRRRHDLESKGFDVGGRLFEARPKKFVPL